ncbi:peptidoglycan bridge formation glycyltransferase FemA/FemB family protein [Patescibacteria group bacterium]|nr:peptidoglycan bridge formation glycyltransferase FemA/FemB family protein [Patescibacteria group bacterium]MBU1473109.1 peptidoglycan bridge formation glycyltransferase FemA/FemB family protein [Patescibacteria group bacterium]MBU2459645.1 peptidoglycan bridge formation glycyltransferase FemA/FemB family protein [Patescibacteria group bacterium]MBU2544452.1 peptidoglycan bridge formation glycyltransferase FemA/FemB family protein [Patescibacteria group bacterium]
MPDMEVQQSLLYKRYVRALGWRVIGEKGKYIFIKSFPFIGGLAKIQRITSLPEVTGLAATLSHHHVRTVIIEPDTSIAQAAFDRWASRLSRHFKISKTPYIPTKTILIDISRPEQLIFKAFSEAKRRGVRRAIKHGVIIRESMDINTFIKTKNRASGFLGFMTTYGVRQLWQIFAPKHTAILLAYHAEKTQNNKPLGGILLLFWNHVAYYWIACASKHGKKFFTPTFLVWEAIKLAKSRGCKLFDFVGVWDERNTQHYKEWIGFTKFKEGFGGKSLYYPIVK